MYTSIVSPIINWRFVDYMCLEDRISSAIQHSEKYNHSLASGYDLDIGE